MTFGIRLKKIREKRGWQQWKLAEALGVEQATVSRLENDEWEPSGPVRRLIELLEFGPPEAGEAA